MTVTTATEFAVSRAIGPTVRARALVSTVPFSARYDLDRVNGVVSRIGHPLQGEKIAGRLFIAPGVQGGVAGGWALMAMAKAGIGFAGLVLGDTNPVMVQGAVTAGIPIAAGFAPELLDIVRTGDLLELDPQTHALRIIERAVR